MKKILLILPMVILFSCTLEVQQSKAYDSDLCSKGYGCIFSERKTIDGMEYMIFASQYSGRSTFVVNLTKDKLEIELIKKQLKE